MHHGTLIRSAHHSVNNAHAAAVYTGLTGHDRGDATVAIGTGPNDYPAIGSVVGLCRPPVAAVVPYVSLPYITTRGAGGPPQPGFFGGWLGRNARPAVRAERSERPRLRHAGAGPPGRRRPRALRRPQAPGGRPGRGAGGARARPTAQDMDGFQARAFDLLTSPATQRAFQLDREHPRVRDAYGRNIYGQSVLLARRLIEAGTRVACISWAPDANATWDTHGNNFASSRTSCCRSSTPPVEPARRPGRARAAGADARGGHGRVRPHPEDQRRRRAATTGTSATA